MCMFDQVLTWHAYIPFVGYVPAVQKVLEKQKENFYVAFKDEDGQEHNDYVIAIDGCNQGSLIGAVAKGGSKHVTLENCQHLIQLCYCCQLRVANTYGWCFFKIAKNMTNWFAEA